MKAITHGFIFTLIAIAISAPMMVQAGTLTIHNQNCTHKTGNWKTKKEVTVHVYNEFRGCTEKKVTVHRNRSETIEIAATDKNGYACGKYRHEAKGTTFGKYDVYGNEDSRVICKKDWAGVCQCTKV